MKKKFLRGVATFLAAVMILPTTVWAGNETEGTGGNNSETEYIYPTSGFKINKVSGKLYDGGKYDEIQLSLNQNVDPAKVSWNVTQGSEYVTVDENGLVKSKGLLGSTATPKIKVRATYDDLVNPAKSVYSEEITLNKRALVENSMSVTTTYDIQQKYKVGESFNRDGIKVTVKYTDAPTEAIELSANEYTVTPESLALDTNEVTISYTYNGDTLSQTMGVRVEEEKEDTIQSVEIYAPPYDGMQVDKGTTFDAITLTVTWLDGETGKTYDDKVIATKSDANGVRLTGYTIGNPINENTTFYATYGGVSSENVTINVKEDKGEEKKLLSITLDTEPTTTKYREGQTLSLSGLKLYAVYSDENKLISYSSAISDRFTVSRSKLNTAGTYDIAVTYKEGDYTGVVSFTVTVEHVVDVTGLSTADSGYKKNSEATIAIGEELEWDEIFDEVTIKYKENGSAKTKVITNASELDAFLSGAKLHLEVDDKSGSDADVVEASDLNSDGQVKLLLWLEYNDTKYTTSSTSYDFIMDVEESECMVQLRASSSSSTVKAAAVFGTFKEALAAIEDEADFDDYFDDYDLGNYAIYISLGEDQKFTGTFKPDYDNDITIDLNGYELKLNSDWIEYDDYNDDISITVTNTDSETDAAKMTYLDKSITITVDKGDALTFSKGEIPGIYDITIASVTNGTIKADKTTVILGDDVKFTITPSSGYVISTVKVNNKSVTSSDAYELSEKTGVATYTLEDVDDDVEITATFTKETAKEEEKSAADTWTNPFTDVTKNAQYYDAVAFVCSEGLMNGVADNAYTSATKFKPMENMTRAQFVTVLGRLAGIDVTKYSGTSFTDVSTTDDAKAAWAAPYIEWAVQMGITNGTDTRKGTFSPSDPVTHQQMYLFMYRYAMTVANITTPLTGVSLTSIKDYTEIADWAEDGVKFASKNGILITSGGKLTPADNALRCELAMLLHGFCTKVLNYND